MKNIIFLNNWGDPPQRSLNRYIYQTPNHDGIWKNIRGVSNLNEADYYVILDGYKKYKELNAKKKIYFQREPPVIVAKHAFENDKALFTGSYKRHYHLATWQLKIPFEKLVNLKRPEKIKLISTVTSSKQNTKGQRQRIQIAKSVEKAIPSMDFFGRGFKPLTKNGYCKKEGLLKYTYSLACENCSIPNYFTEKIIDCILCWTKPIYWGCSNIGKFLPKGSYVTVDIFKPNAVNRIVEETKKPVDYEALKEARNLILYKYNLWPSIKKVIEGLQ